MYIYIYMCVFIYVYLSISNITRPFLAGAQALAAFLESNRSLVFLDLSAASIGPIGVAALFEVFALSQTFFPAETIQKHFLAPKITTQMIYCRYLSAPRPSDQSASRSFSRFSLCSRHFPHKKRSFSGIENCDTNAFLLVHFRPASNRPIGVTPPFEIPREGLG